MREILFRGKRLNNGKWVEGYFFRQYGSNEIITADNELYYHVLPETVGQYTGLKDKNGTRIFEGDILSAHFDDAFPDEETRGWVCWHDYGWHIRIGAHLDTLESDWVSHYFEIIGNIHDNPELLEGEHNG